MASWAFPLVDARANFLKPIKFGDNVEIASRVSEFRRSSFDVEHHSSVDGELAVEGGETRVWAVRSKDDPEKIAATAIPEQRDRQIRAGVIVPAIPGNWSGEAFAAASVVVVQTKMTKSAQTLRRLQGKKTFGQAA